jgi:hypothetical protein
MKLYLDTKNRRFVKSAASNVALTTLVLKRRDQVPIQLIFVENGVAITPPSGTTASIGLKARFADSNFLAFAAPGTQLLDLFTEPVEAAFLSNPASLPALLEIKWGTSATALRTATLQVELQNSVITGDEGTPAIIPDGKATQAEAQAGESNEKWMTPLRTAQAIAVLAPPPTWDSILDKPTDFAPAAHTHPAADITDFAAAVQLVSPADHTHLAQDITDFQAAVQAISIGAQQLPPISYQTTRHEGDGTTAAFAPPGVLTEADSPSAISVSVNGVLQEPSVDYTLDIANNRLVLDAPLPAGDKIVITRPLLLPSNTTLTAEQLGAIPASALLAETTARISADRRLLGLTLALS